MTTLKADMQKLEKFKITLDTSKCSAYGVCVGLAPDVFDLPKGSPVAVLRRDVVNGEDFEDVEEAVYACPAQALSLSRVEVQS